MKLFAFLFFLSHFVYCQSNRFVYEYKSVKDTIKNDTTKAVMYLDVYKEGSIFYDVQNFKNDSIASIQNEKLSSFENRVYKKYPNYDVSLIVSLYGDIYIVSDLRKMDWKISSEKKEINKFSTQKATLHFAGRIWTAWFSTDIPISDGPYKFHGLPGLVLKIEDNTHTHSFGLVAIEKLNGILSYKTSSKKMLSIDHEKYRKLYKEYRGNPSKNLMGLDIIETQDGKSNSEFKRNMEKYYKNRTKNNNNLLEVDLLKTK
ncbi:GLPGLI family protein [Chryseobacterium sp. ISL-6]|uniref:GLPGLI family protein n=1 Tax=Chryseobacterium sp. ISL-6 TaxID=2819143 RepID=UPI001BE7FE4C|nr:GLPGLI family protein [Chryseobacterium sp. ISL-6]MBT2619698.1 GLPGLI family protein [Chryseobacterium sp. ISL-6]